MYILLCVGEMIYSFPHIFVIKGIIFPHFFVIYGVIFPHIFVTKGKTFPHFCVNMLIFPVIEHII